ncbi:transcriptional regulator [Clostridiales bacterium AM23-16LB]|jgi:DNA-binding Xre family transcriptional regulator|nr:transcriptional regulator [Clostridiales bacterium AM23-16LB]
MMAETIKRLLKEQKKTKTWLARELGRSRGNLHVRLEKDDFRESELKKIAELLDCTYEVSFVSKKTRKKV